MSTNQAVKGTVKPCPNGCGKDIFFESRYGPDGKLIEKEKDGKMVTRWWMMEDVSKQQHNCSKRGIKSDPIPMRESKLVDKSLLRQDELPNTPEPSDNKWMKTTSEIPKVKEIDVVDIAESQLRAETKINLRVLDLLDNEIQNHWKEHNWPENGQKMGLWMKLLIEMNKK